MDSFENKVTMAIEDWYDVESEDGNYEFAYGTVDFLSTKPNSHKHIYSEEIIKQYAPSVINKWVIAHYDDITNDVTTHVSNQHIIGRVPEQEVKYRYEDGYLIASVDVILSKLYATDVYNLFKQHNYRAVSIEELVGFSEDTENLRDGIDEKIVEGFNITAISVLGLSYRPSVPDANIQLTKMSEIDDTNVQDAEKEYVKYSQNKNKNTMDNIIKKLDDIAESVKKLSKEETMAEENKKVEELESVETLSEEKTEETNAEQGQDEEMSCGGGKDEKMDEASVNADKEDETVENADSKEDEKEDEDNSDDSEEKMSEQTMAELESKLAEAEEKIQKYESELSELKQFKDKVEMSEKQKIVNETLSHVKEFLTEEEYAEVVSKADSFSYSEIGLWKNETLASIADKALEKIANMSHNEESGVLDMGMSQEINEKKSIFD